MSENKRRPSGDYSRSARPESYRSGERPVHRSGIRSDEYRNRSHASEFSERRRPTASSASSGYAPSSRHLSPSYPPRNSARRMPSCPPSRQRPSASRSERRPQLQRPMPSTARHSSVSSSARRRPNRAAPKRFAHLPHFRFPQMTRRPIHSARHHRYKVDWVRLTVLTVCLGVMLFGATNLILYFSNSRRTHQTNEELQAMREAVTETAPQSSAAPAATAVPAPVQPEAAPEIPPFQTIGTEILPEMQKLYEKNNDLIGWIDIPKVVNLPVVYRDNTFYLTHDFYGDENKSGTIFLDEYHPFEADTQYLVLHGHSMHDGSMFGRLTKYAYGNYLREHGLVTYSSLYKKENYVVFAVLTVPGDSMDPDFLPYTGMPTFSSDTAFNNFIDTIKERSLYNTTIDVQPTDALLTMSTCLEDDRIIIVCRRQREGESPESLQFAVSQMVGK